MGAMPKVEIPGNIINWANGEDDPQRTQLLLHIGWDNGLPAAGIEVGIIGVDPETGLRRDIGGVFMTMNWRGANDAIRGFRSGRDGSHGKPE